MENDKAPGNEGLSKEFYEVCWAQMLLYYTM